MTAESRSSSRLLAWLQLVRLPNVFTAMADVLMGFWLTHAALSPIGVFLLLLGSSTCLYIAGMVLNDVFDIEQDRRERPQRPLPSGRIAEGYAECVGMTLLALGVLLGWCVVFLQHDGQAGEMFLTARPGMIAIALAVLILLYDRALKRTFLGPIAMGGCRFFNVLLGMSAIAEPWTAANLTVAAGLGIYIIGVTWFARREAAISKRIQLIGGTLAALAGLVFLWYWPRLVLPEKLFATLQFEPGSWTLVWILLALVIGSRFLQAILDPQPVRVQAAVKSGILSIIVLDAVTVFALRGPGPSIAIMSLILPTIALGAWIYST